MTWRYNRNIVSKMSKLCHRSKHKVAVDCYGEDNISYRSKFIDKVFLLSHFLIIHSVLKLMLHEYTIFYLTNLYGTFILVRIVSLTCFLIGTNSIFVVSYIYELPSKGMNLEAHTSPYWTTPKAPFYMANLNLLTHFIKHD